MEDLPSTQNRHFWPITVSECFALWVLKKSLSFLVF
jgi:hypothetical protein